MPTHVCAKSVVSSICRTMVVEELVDAVAAVVVVVVVAVVG